nr:hypothetical protein [Tanacetum cinerariifolium]
MNDLLFKLDNFQKNKQDFQEKFEQIQDDLLNQMRNFMQNLHDRPHGVDKEHEATTNTELPSTEDIQPLKRSMEDMMLELVKICQEKEFLCIHDDIDDLIKSALNSKLLLINLNSQHLDKKEQEVKNVIKQMEYEHLRIIPETESDEVTESNAENLVPIPNVVLREKLLSITRLISNIESLNDNSTPDRVFNSFESDNSLLDNFSPEFETFCNHSEETRSGNTTHVDNPLPKYDSFCFKFNPNQERLINLVENDIPDNASNNSLLEEVDLFLYDNLIPSCIENVADDPEGNIYFLEELLIDDSILSHESFDSNFEDNPSIPRPPPEPPDADIGEEIQVVMINKDKFDDDYKFFMFDKVFSLLFAKSEDTIFNPGISD